MSPEKGCSLSLIFDEVVMRSLVLMVVMLFVVQTARADESFPLHTKSSSINHSEIMKASAPAPKSELAGIMNALSDSRSGSRCNAGGNEITKYGCNIYTRRDNSALFKEVTFRGGVGNPAVNPATLNPAVGFQVLLTW